MESDAPVTGLQYAENPDFVSYEPECQQLRSQPLSSNQIEMDSLPSPSPVGRQSQDKALGSGETQYDMTSTSCLPQHALKREKSNDTSLHVASEPTKLGGEQLLFTSEDTPLPTDDLAAPITREKTMPAIGPATDKPTPIAKETTSEGPVLYITLLLASTGARHPYKLDGKYMQKRNVEVDGNNPIHMSLYKLKELILRDWRDEWDSKPSSPESIRLICMGKMLNDKSKLCDIGFANGLTPHIVHMTIKPQELIDEDEANKTISKTSGGAERSPGCRCVIQ